MNVPDACWPAIEKLDATIAHQRAEIEKLNKQNAALQRNCDRQFASAADQMIVDAQQRADIETLVMYLIEVRKGREHTSWVRAQDLANRSDAVQAIIDRYGTS